MLIEFENVENKFRESVDSSDFKNLVTRLKKQKESTLLRMEVCISLQVTWQRTCLD